MRVGCQGGGRYKEGAESQSRVTRSSAFVGIIAPTMANHMNLFEPYASKAAHHEDSLTRAFLLVLRGVPVAHSAWLGLVDRAHRAAGGEGVPCLHELGAPTVRTQTAQVEGHVDRVISLVQTDEEYFKDGDTKATDRRQILDGVVAYDDSLAIVVENKPCHKDIWAGQLDVRVPDGVTLDPKVACVMWKDVVLAWAGLLDAGHLGSAETVLLGDFLEYVERHLPQLGPYSTVGLCGENLDRLNRRCRALLQSIAGGDRVQHHRGWSWYILLAEEQSAKQIALKPMAGEHGLDLVIEFAPGDTMRQAKRLYSECGMDEVLGLRESGWTVRPNFHVAHMTRNLLHTHSTISIESYWNIWAGNTKRIQQVQRAKFEETFATFVREGLAALGDRAAYEKEVLRTERQTYNLCPGIAMFWRKRLHEAALLDDRGQLETEVRSAIERASQSLHLKLPWLQAASC